MKTVHDNAGWVLLALTTIAWLPVAQAGFVWDDLGLVVNNTMTGSLANVPAFFAMDLWDSAGVGESVSGYYRPLMLLSLAVDRALWGLDPVGHHLHSLAWHLLAVAGAHRLLQKRLSAGQALFAAGLFALHPVQGEAVTWVAARNDPMAAALGLWALHQVAWSEPTRRRSAAAFVLATLAGLAKESVVLLPVLLAAIDVVEARRPDWRRHLPLFAGVLVVGLARAAAGVGGATWPPDIGWQLLFLRLPDLLLLGGRLVFVPWPQACGYALEWLDRAPTWQVVAGASGLVAGAALLWRSRAAGRLALLGPAWVVLALAPLVLPLADKGLFGERYLYLGLLGIGITIALAVRHPVRLGLLLAGPAILLLNLRFSHWTDEVTLWEHAVADFPSPYSEGGLGHAYRNEGRHEEALVHYIRALDDPLPDVSVCPQTVRMALDLEKPALAAQLGHWTRARGCSGRAYRGHASLAFAMVGEWEAAATAVQGGEGTPTERQRMVEVALRLVSGDTAGAEMLAAESQDPAGTLDKARLLVEGR